MVCPVCITTVATTVLAPTVIGAITAVKIKQMHDRRKPPIIDIKKKPLNKDK
jgi:hypothetical protein